MNLYEESWAIYKSHSEVFQDDLEYYLSFTEGKVSLETFAGYGRVSNFLKDKGVDISINELSPDLAKFINIPTNKKDIGDILNYKSEKKFERIFAGYNSFCLIRDEKDIRRLFNVFQDNLIKGGKVSLSYYHPDEWGEACSYEFNYNNKVVKYIPSYDLSERKNKLGIWKDVYEIDGESIEHEYKVRIYEDSSDLVEMLSHTKLKLIDTIYNYNNPNIMERGWIEYVLMLS
jgi:hypothetical protein